MDSKHKRKKSSKKGKKASKKKPLFPKIKAEGVQPAFTKNKDDLALLAILERDPYFNPRTWQARRKSQQKSSCNLPEVRDTKAARLHREYKKGCVSDSNEGQQDGPKEGDGPRSRSASPARHIPTRPYTTCRARRDQRNSMALEALKLTVQAYKPLRLEEAAPMKSRLRQKSAHPRLQDKPGERIPPVKGHSADATSNERTFPIGIDGDHSPRGLCVTVEHGSSAAQPSAKFTLADVDVDGGVRLTPDPLAPVTPRSGQEAPKQAPGPLLVVEANSPPDPTTATTTTAHNSEESKEQQLVNKKGVLFRQALTAWLEDSEVETTSSSEGANSQVKPDEENSRDNEHYEGETNDKGDEVSKGSKSEEIAQGSESEELPKGSQGEEMSKDEKRSQREENTHSKKDSKLGETSKSDDGPSNDVRASAEDKEECQVNPQDIKNVQNWLERNGEAGEDASTTDYDDAGGSSYLQKTARRVREASQQGETDVDEEDVLECRRQYRSEVLHLAEQLQAFKDRCDTEVSRIQQELEQRKEALVEQRQQVEEERERLRVPALAEQVQEEKDLLKRKKKLIHLEEQLISKQEHLTSKERDLNHYEKEIEEVEGFLQRRYELSKSREERLVELEQMLRGLEADLEEKKEGLASGGNHHVVDQQQASRAAHNWEILRRSVEQTRKSLQTTLQQTRAELTRTRTREDRKDSRIQDLQKQIESLEAAQDARDQRIKELETHLTVNIEESVRGNLTTTPSQVSSMASLRPPPARKPAGGGSLASLGLVWMNGGTQTGAGAGDSSPRSTSGPVKRSTWRQRSLLQLGEGVVVNAPERPQPFKHPALTGQQETAKQDTPQPKTHDKLTSFEDYKGKGRCKVM